jgi:hypothetical protein
MYTLQYKLIFFEIQGTDYPLMIIQIKTNDISEKYHH